ncbi:hypothetical protein EW146_g1530 [Bondarzewia mesenterica]|uniref:Protein LTV1 n=1 Tax=Bondarzewia mesenterica TaxID=1095465 RepID=A0A4S4M3L6_9AGAM|nr:hypothetical protein EW146_g1530 [Bondarzewia mesenterica]
MPPKSIFRQPGAQHFQLVHRSQRDPLIHDPEASQHVLKPFIPENQKKACAHKISHILSPSDLAHDAQRPNIGEATLYGIYYDDTDYDYMQHLRPVGVQEDGVESVLIEAPSTQKSGSRRKENIPISLRDLPAEALPSTSELPRNFENQEAIPSSIAGFQPDMDPHLRQVLEALEDDAFVNEDLDDDFFGDLVRDGERGPEEHMDFQFIDEGIAEEAGIVEGKAAGEEDDNWEARFAAFKKAQQADAGNWTNASDDEDICSEGMDTIGRMPDFSVVGGKRRRKGTSDASGYSMSSSSMFRNEGLRTLDERFDQIEREYKSDEEPPDSEDSEDAPQLITSREDFENLMDEFLDNFEISGGKMKPTLPGIGAEKLEALRNAMGLDQRVREQGSDEAGDDDDDIFAAWEKEDKRDRWDVETVLTTHTNLENHPRLIRARQSKPVPKIHLDPRTGLPSIIEPDLVEKSALQRRPAPPNVDGETLVRKTVTRSRSESKEEKKARKQSIKADRQVRRVEKKATKDQFSVAVKQQTQIIAGKQVKTRKL